ncbi:MAG: hypothetical protein H8Z69_04190 [Nanohaloarchaea archaeon]|nr:hypothetical protein [Candidatus Nanohaloarchaea archaeon]
MNKKELFKQKMGIIEKCGGHKEWNKKSGVNRHGDEYRHFMVKSAIYNILAEEGHEVRTEVEVPNGWIVDVIDADTAHIYEVETNLSPGDRKSKVQRYLQAECMGRVIEDIIFLDPTELPLDMKELRERLRSEVIF